MIRHKKSLIIVISVLVILIVTDIIIKNVSSKSDYATLDIQGEYNSRIFLNDKEEYDYMHYYSYEPDFDLRIRNGKNIFFALFNKEFEASSKDTERNFLMYTEGGFGVQIYGLYIKKSSLDKLLKPTKDNISKIVITDSDGKDALSFTPKDKSCFDYFLSKYKKELSNYYFPLYEDNEDYFNDEYTYDNEDDEYRIDAEYQNGTISRFLMCIDKNEFDAIASHK